MSNNVSNQPDFDKTVYTYEVHAVVDNTGNHGAIIDTLNRNIVNVAKGLKLPYGKHLTRLTVTAEVLESQATPQYSNAPDDLDQDDTVYGQDMAEIIFEQTNGKVPAHSGVTDLF